MRTIHAADLFCGAGGTSTALAQACELLGAKLRLTAVNHWPTAVETHAANHPQAAHACESLDNVDPRKLIRGKLDVLCASPECFPAGTLILTSVGLVPIENVTTRDYVLTHAGNWQRVTAVMKTTKPTVVVRGHGHYGLETTAEHPFYTRTRRKHWPKANRAGVWRWTAPDWAPAAELASTRRFWATPTRIPARPRFLPTLLGGLEDAASFWWVVGRWLGDGSVSTREGKGGEVTICCGNHEADAIAPKLEAGWPHVRWTRRQVRTATLFECRSTNMAHWLVGQFGKLAHGKTVPTWAMGMAVELRASLLDGYLSADGHHDGRRQEATTVSKALAVGIRLLAETLGHRVALHKATQHSTVIEGREVTGRDVHRVMWVSDRQRSYAAEVSGMSWARVRSVEPGREAVEVYNLSVDEDESYVADGIVVHNCTHHSNARGGKPRDDQSRATAWHVVRWAEALRPKVVLVENVREMLTWGPLGSDGKPLKSRRGETWAAWVNALRSVGYTVGHRLVNAADYGGATTRTRLFVVAVRGRRAVPWAESTHAKDPVADGLFASRKPWRAAREVIDWTLPGKSIFGRKNPLKPNTLKWIAEGIRRFWGVDPEPFLIGQQSGAVPRGVGHPTPTIAASGAISVIQPFVIGTGQQNARGSYVYGSDRPLPTVTSADNHGVVQPFVLAPEGIHRGNAPRDVGQPLPTITAGRGGGHIVQPFVMHQTHGGRLHDPANPLPTVTGAHRGEMSVIEPFLVPTNYGEHSQQRPRTHAVGSPMPTVVGSVTHAVIELFLVKYYATGGACDVADPLDTLTGRDRFGLVTPAGLIADVLFRMLQPHELAAAMGFPAGYVFKGRREDVVKQIGNAVEVHVAQAHLTELLTLLAA